MNHVLALGLRHKWRLFFLRAIWQRKLQGEKKKTCSCQSFSPPSSPWPMLRMAGKLPKAELFQTERSGSFYHITVGILAKTLQNCRKISWGYIFLFLFYEHSCNKISLHFTESLRIISICMFPLTVLNSYFQNIFGKSEQQNQNKVSSESYDHFFNASPFIFCHVFQNFFFFVLDLCF